MFPELRAMLTCEQVCWAPEPTQITAYCSACPYRVAQAASEKLHSGSEYRAVSAEEMAPAHLLC